MWQRLKMLWRNLARKQNVEGDLDAEIRSYQEMLEDEKVRAGADARAARPAVLQAAYGSRSVLSRSWR
jgi:hypothetical protein